MEEALLKLVETGNATAIIAAGVVYLIVFIQRKQTKEKRDDDKSKLLDDINSLREELNQYKLDAELKQKDINYLLDENVGVKADIKEIKATLQTMALALERIAAKYDKD